MLVTQPKHERRGAWIEPDMAASRTGAVFVFEHTKIEPDSLCLMSG